MKYVKGIIGGLIGGLIASIPWILLYVYGNFIFSLLAMVIAMGVNFGYRKFGGKVDKKLPIFISVISIVTIVFVTLIVIPILLLGKEGFQMSLSNLNLLYKSSEFVTAITKDLVFAVLFTFLGISGIVKTTKMEVNGEDSSEYKNPYVAAKEANQKILDKIKEIFVKRKAIDKNSAVSLEELVEINSDKELKRAFNQLKIQQIIKKKSGKYYFSEKAEKNAFYRFITLYLKILLWLIPVTILIVILTVK